ncbi:hypothetical protein B0H63DRAFT_180387 [Podospora didyma]|uniref:Uncharacterized protein n=1 Tax=Podospora didyma TaxID=330526 RepID=A0AAE0NP98_9PEZI|nr:hypothetical protein B0H63DRAFT_180387 [Podospora didyma]
MATDNHPIEFRNAKVSFAVDISGSTYGPTLTAEKGFIRSVSSQLSPRSRLDVKVLPWDHEPHTIRSLTQLSLLEDKGGTDPAAILTSDAHKSALAESSLWFLMTDGLIQKEARVKFAHDIAMEGIHGISCVIVIFGNPSVGPGNCDISVGISVFAAVPDCAFLFCNETNGDLRILQTKGSFNALLKGTEPPILDASSRWESQPRILASDFAAVSLPPPKKLSPTQLALQNSIVIDLEDLFANRLSEDEVQQLFDNEDNMATLLRTSQSRDQQDRFQTWIYQQAIEPGDPLHMPRVDFNAQAEALFKELLALMRHEQQLPAPLQGRLQAAHLDNMKRFLGILRQKAERAEHRNKVSCGAIISLSAPAESSSALNRRRERRQSVGQLETPSDLPAADGWSALWKDITNPSLKGLLFTTGVRENTGSFKGTCPICGASDITLAWLFRPVVLPPNGGRTRNFPLPGSRTHLAFPLAMGHFAETSGVLPGGPALPRRGSFFSTVSLPSTATPPRAPPSAAPFCPALACDPCSVLYSRDGAHAHDVTAALPLVRYAENRQAIHAILDTAFEGRFSDTCLPQVFLSVLLLSGNMAGPPHHPGAPDRKRARLSLDNTSRLSISDSDLRAAGTAVVQNNTYRNAIEWTVRDLMHAVPVPRELSESFSQSHAETPSESVPPLGTWPLGTVLASAFESLDLANEEPASSSAFGDATTATMAAGTISTRRNPSATGRALAAVGPLLRYPLPGFVAMLRAAALDGTIDAKQRQRAIFCRVLLLLCEELEKSVCGVEQVGRRRNALRLLEGILWQPATTAHIRSLTVPRNGFAAASLGDHSHHHGREHLPGSRTLGRKPVKTVSVSSLRFTPLLSRESYNMLRRADEELRELEDPAFSWPGAAIALFLHALFREVKSGSGKLEAWHEFESVIQAGDLDGLLFHPEVVVEEDVESLWERMQVEGLASA